VTQQYSDTNTDYRYVRKRGFQVEFDDNIPIYQQIVDQFKLQIVSGRLQCGERVPSVRELALEMGVSTNTLQKALAVLEQEKLFFTERTSGRFVTNDTGIINALKEEMLDKELARFLEAAKAMGYTGDEIQQVLSQYLMKIELGRNGQ